MAGLGNDGFVGRAAELRMLEEELARAKAGMPRTVLVEGSAGIGKSALVRHFVSRAAVPAVLPPLDEAVDAGLLEVRETTTALIAAFPHKLVRAAVYDNLGRSRRSTLHAMAAELLDRPASLDHRAAAALVHDADLAAELSAHAQDETVQGDLLRAAGHLLTAARLDPDRARRERHLLDAVELLLAGGDVVGAMARAEEVAELSAGARRQYALGHLALLSGHQRRAERLLREAWEGADPATEPEVRVMAGEKLAEICAAQVRPEEAINWARRALAHDMDHYWGASALTTLVVYLALVGRPGEALPLVEAIETDAGEPAPREVAGVLARGIHRGLWPQRWMVNPLSALSLNRHAPRFIAKTLFSATGFVPTNTSRAKATR